MTTESQLNPKAGSGFRPFDLSGQVALITGGNSGIGLGMALALAQAGADLMVWGTSETKNREALERLRDHAASAEALCCDVASEAEVDDAFRETVRRFGKVDACFANAGVGGGGRTAFSERSAAEWRRVLAVNLDGVFYTFRAASRHMITRGEGGRLVGTASLAAIEGAARNEHYAASKAGMLGMIRALAVELARHRITANAILPGWIDTAMTSPLIGNAKFASQVLQRVPLRRWGTGADFGGVAVYLMSSASSFHTGDCLVIDGGYALF
jgi:NAD(P)-dependent dehydrogenase (short-subunit alcohol dehydrogenase family)